MDLHLDLEEEELEYLEELGVIETLSKNLTESLKGVAQSKPVDAMLSLVEMMSKIGDKNMALVEGFSVLSF